MAVLFGDKIDSITTRVAQICSTSPYLYFNESDATANNKYWDFLASGEAFRLRAVNDAYNSSSDIIHVQRTGVTIDNVTFPNGNIGIGTTNPSQRLTVAGNISATGSIAIGNPAGFLHAISLANNRAIGLDSSNGWTDQLSGFRVFKFTDNNLYIDNFDKDIIVRGVSYTQRLRITESGNVGIGTVTSPGQRLTVSGNISASGFIDAGTQFLGQDADTVSVPSFSWTGDTNTGMYRPAADTLGFSVSGVDALRISNIGNIGIGTTSPGAKLDIRALSATSRQPALGITNEGLNSSIYVFQNNRNAFNAPLTIYSQTTAAESSLFSMYNESSGSIAGWLATGRGSSGNPNNWLQYITLRSLGRVTIGQRNLTSNARVQINSDEGLGEGLDINRNSTSSVGPVLNLRKSRLATSTEPSASDYAIVANNDNLGTIRFSGDDGSSFRPACEIEGEVDGTPFNSMVPGRLTFFTATSSSTGSSVLTERMRINSSGFVGIGTSSPAYNLDLVSNSSAGNSPFLAIRNTSGSTPNTFGPGIVLENNVSGKFPYVIQQNQGSNSDFSISRLTSPFTRFFTIDQSGDVGINVFPKENFGVDTKLHVKADNTDVYAALFEGSGTTFTPYIALKSIDTNSGQRIPGFTVINQNNIQTSSVFFEQNTDGSGLIEFRTSSAGSASTDKRVSAVKIWDAGISYPRATALRGTGASYIAFGWNNPFLYAHVDANNTLQIAQASDYRLKTNITNLSSTLDKLSQLRPVEYNGKNENGVVDNSKLYHGMIAHEVATLYPTLVTGNKDEVDQQTGEPVYQSIFYAGLVPDLVKAVQELKQITDNQYQLLTTQAQIISSLEARVTQLEATS